jgi:hypothetical protein
MKPTTGSYAIAFGAPLSEAIRELERSAESLTNASEKVIAGPTTTFGEQIKKAVKARMRPRFGANTPTADEESFGQKVKRAAEQKAGTKKQHAEQVARDSKRYPKPRKRTLSE